jgi:DNA polymerase III subunit beta
MKFIVSSGILQKQLSALSGVIPSSAVVPITENFLFELKQGKLVVSATDLQISMITELDVESSDEGSIAVPAKHFLDTLKSLPEQPISISTNLDTNSIEINSYKGRYKLTGEKADDFPKIPVPDGDSRLMMSSEILANAIQNTLFAIGSDDLRPAMTGLYLKLDDKGAYFVSTDGNRLVKYERKDLAAEQASSMIIPKKALQLLRGALPSEVTDVRAEFNSSNAFFSFGHVKLICRLIDENFPDYQNAIPADNTKILTIDRSELSNSLKLLAIYASKTTNQVRLSLTTNKLQIFAEDADFANEANETLQADYEGEDMEIGFNAKYLIEILNNLTSKDVKFYFSTPNRAALVLPKEKADEEDVTLLIMPMMLSSYEG